MPKIVDHNEYRRTLLKESFECFARKGYSVVTMRELSKHLGVSTGTLYHYFPSKKAIFEAVVDYIAEEDSAVEQYMIARGHTHSARVDALFSFLEEHGDYLAKQMVIFVDFYRQHGADEAATNPSITRAVARFREFIQFYLQIDDPELVTMVECLLNGYVLVIMGPHAHFSIKNQSVLLKKLLESYRSA